MDNQILSIFSPLVLIGVGIILIAIEAFIYSFFVVWFGIGFIVVGLISSFYSFSDGMWQLSIVSIVALLLLFTLRNMVKHKFLNSHDKAPNNDFLNESGFGVIKDDKVYFKATYWDIGSHDKFENDEKVEVIKATKGVAHIKRLEKK